MSILIEGMEMPKNCEIIIRIDEKGEVYVYDQYPTKLYKAIPVPPHGRLIDADLLDTDKMIDVYISGDLYRHEWNIDEWLNSAPTVIPADKEGT